MATSKAAGRTRKHQEEEVEEPVRKKKSGRSSTSMAAPEGNKWQNLLDEMNQGQGGPFFFPKEGKTRLRLTPQPGTDDEFYSETRSVFRGKEKVKYIILAYVAGTSQGELPEEMKYKVHPVVISKTVLKSILSLLAEGYDLLDPEDGHGLTLIRTGQKLDTSYNVMPSPSPVPLPDDLEYPDDNLEELARLYYEQSLERSQSGPTDDDEEEQPPQRRGRNSSRRSSGADW